MTVPTVVAGSCPYCPGQSTLRTRGGHDPACPAAQRFPLTTVTHRPTESETP